MTVTLITKMRLRKFVLTALLFFIGVGPLCGREAYARTPTTCPAFYATLQASFNSLDVVPSVLLSFFEVAGCAVAAPVIPAVFQSPEQIDAVTEALHTLAQENTVVDPSVTEQVYGDTYGPYTVVKDQVFVISGP